MAEYICFGISALFMLVGLGFFASAAIGVWRFGYVLSRMHAAALGDTAGLAFVMLSLVFASSDLFLSLKLFLVVLFMWFSSPASSHLIAEIEYLTSDTIKEHCRLPEDNSQSSKIGDSNGDF